LQQNIHLPPLFIQLKPKKCRSEFWPASGKRKQLEATARARQQQLNAALVSGWPAVQN